MPDEKRQLKVFLCHASADKPKVRELYNRLKEDGVDAWIDEVKLLPGQDWDLEIRKAIREADVILIVLSKYSISKEGYVQKEIKRALDIADEKPEGTIFVIPARLDECDVPNSLQRWHWVNLFADDSYDILVKALIARAEQIGMFPPRKKGKDTGKKFFLRTKTKYIVAIIGIVAATLITGLLNSSLTEKQGDISIPTATIVTNVTDTTTPSPTIDIDILNSRTYARRI